MALYIAKGLVLSRIDHMADLLGIRAVTLLGYHQAVTVAKNHDRRSQGTAAAGHAAAEVKVDFSALNLSGGYHVRIGKGLYLTGEVLVNNLFGLSSC